MRSLSWTRALLAIVVAFTAATCTSAKGVDQEGEEVEGESVPIPELTPAERAEIDAMIEPEVSATQSVNLAAKYGHLDPKRLIPRALLDKAVAYFDANKTRFANKDYLSVVDFSENSRESRLYVVDLSSGSVWRMHVAHGSGSDPKRTGWATMFSNQSGSLKSSLGYYRTAETYEGKHGLSLRLDGLSSSNSNVRARAIVVHGAKYVSDEDEIQGRSNGCLAVSFANKPELVRRIKQGSLIYAGLSR